MSSIPPVSGISAYGGQGPSDPSGIIDKIEKFKEDLQNAIGDYPNVDIGKIDQMVLSMHDYLESKKSQIEGICKSLGWDTHMTGDYKTMLQDSIRTLHNIHMAIHDDPKTPDILPSLTLANENVTELAYYMTNTPPPKS